MSILRYRYHDTVDIGTVTLYSSQLTNWPATNIQNEILEKAWKTEDGFVIMSTNHALPFQESAPGSVKVFLVPSGTYTGAALATKLQSGLLAVGDFAGYTVVYNGDKFTLDSGRTATNIFELSFDDATYSSNTIAVIAGFSHNTIYSGAFFYTSPNTTLGNEHIIEIQLSATQALECFLIAGHKFDSTVALRLRGANGTGIFAGPWNSAPGIVLSQTLTWRSGTITTDFSTVSVKVLQLHWADLAQESSQIGRLWAGGYYEPANHRRNVISYQVRRQRNRSLAAISEAGAVYFNKAEKLKEYKIRVDPLDRYFNPVDQAAYDAMLEEVGNDTPFFISLDHNVETSTIYGYFVGDFQWDRVQNTPTLQLNDLLFLEQK